jgi:DNA-binding MltR family transcriptional regulator
MPALENQAEIDAYYLSDRTQPRAAGVMWAALIERRLDRLFETALRPDKKVYNELFLPRGPLGNYAVKARLAYMLGWIGEDVYADIITISRIRNRFAHDIEAKDFDDAQIAGWLKKMIGYKFLPTSLENAKKEAANNPTVINKALVDVYEDALGDGQMGFRLCIDLILHHLEQCRSNMVKNLSGLPGNWMVTNDTAPESAEGEPE